MPASKKPRKRHKPKPRELPIPFEGSKEDLDGLVEKAIGYVNAIQYGSAKEEDMHHLAAAINTGVALSAMYAAPISGQILRDGVTALASVMQRHQAKGSIVATGDEIKALQAAVTAYADIFKAAPRRARRDAILRVRAALAVHKVRDGEVIEV